MKFKNIITDFFKILTLLCLVAGLASCSFDKKESSQEKAEPNKENGVNLVLKIKGISKDNGLYIQPKGDDNEEFELKFNSELSTLNFEIKYCKGDSISANAIKIDELDSAALEAGVTLEGLSTGIWTFSIRGIKRSWDYSISDYLYEDYVTGTKTQELIYGNNTVQIELISTGKGAGTLDIDFYTFTSFSNEPELTLYYYDEDYYSNVTNDKYPNGISYIDFLKAFTSANPQNESESNRVIRSDDVKTVTLELEDPLEEISDEIQKWGIPEDSTTVNKYHFSSNTFKAGNYFVKLSTGSTTPTVLLSEQLKIASYRTTKHEFIYQHDKREIKYKTGTNETVNGVAKTIKDYLSEDDKALFEEYHYDTYFKGIPKTLEIVPEWDGHTFKGWKYEGSNTLLESGTEDDTYIFLDNTNVAYVTIVAQWE